jgi:hypothetical protein
MQIFIMQEMLQKTVFLSIVFLIGVSIGAIYVPEIITYSKNADDANLEKQGPQNKSSPLKLNTNKKKRFAQIDNINHSSG